MKSQRAFSLVGWIKTIQLEMTERKRVGELTLIFGSMFSGKTTTLIRILETMGRAVRCLYVNHTIDSRSIHAYSTHNVLFDSALGAKLNAEMIKVSSLDELSDEYLSQFDVVCLDEGQFQKNLRYHAIRIVERLGKDLFVAGLIGDYKRRTFGEMYTLFPITNHFIPLKDTLCALCAKEGKRQIAVFTHKTTNKNGDVTIEIGADQYIPLCRECYCSENGENSLENDEKI